MVIMAASDSNTIRESTGDSRDVVPGIGEEAID